MRLYLSETKYELLNAMKEELDDFFVTSGVSLFKTSATDPAVLKSNDLNQVTFDGEQLYIRVLKAEKQKCPRCWKYYAPSTETCCDRCNSVLQLLQTAL